MTLREAIMSGKKFMNPQYKVAFGPGFVMKKYINGELVSEEWSCEFGHLHHRNNMGFMPDEIIRDDWELVD